MASAEPEQQEPRPIKETEVIGEDRRLYDALRFQLTREMDVQLATEALRREHEGLARRGQRTSKSGVVRDAVRFYLASRLAKGTFSEQIAQARAAAGLNLPQAGDAAGLDAPAIYRIEKGRSPRLETLQKLAQAFDVSIVIDPDGVAVIRRNP